MGNYENGAAKAEVLLYETLTAKHFDEYEHNTEEGHWSLRAGPNRLWWVEDGDTCIYEIDLNHGTVNG